jgi:hypothetical protein
LPQPGNRLETPELDSVGSAQLAYGGFLYKKFSLDDLSVITGDDEAGFRVVEYGKSRKVVLPDSLKLEIQGTKLQRELRRRGIGQHTIEKALHAHVRVNTCRKIVAAIEQYKREKSNSRT